MEITLIKTIVKKALLVENFLIRMAAMVIILLLVNLYGEELIDVKEFNTGIEDFTPTGLLKYMKTKPSLLASDTSSPDTSQTSSLKIQGFSQKTKLLPKSSDFLVKVENDTIMTKGSIGLDKDSYIKEVVDSSVFIHKTTGEKGTTMRALPGLGFVTPEIQELINEVGKGDTRQAPQKKDYIDNGEKVKNFADFSIMEQYYDGYLTDNEYKLAKLRIDNYEYLSNPRDGTVGGMGREINSAQETCMVSSDMNLGTGAGFLGNKNGAIISATMERGDIISNSADTSCKMKSGITMNFKGGRNESTNSSNDENDSLISHIIKTPYNLHLQLELIHKLYKSGHLTHEQWKQSKIRILGGGDKWSTHFDEPSTFTNKVGEEHGISVNQTISASSTNSCGGFTQSNHGKMGGHGGSGGGIDGSVQWEEGTSEAKGLNCSGEIENHLEFNASGGESQDVKGIFEKAKGENFSPDVPTSAGGDITTIHDAAREAGFFMEGNNLCAYMTDLSFNGVDVSENITLRTKEGSELEVTLDVDASNPSYNNGRLFVPFNNDQNRLTSFSDAINNGVNSLGVPVQGYYENNEFIADDDIELTKDNWTTIMTDATSTHILNIDPFIHGKIFEIQYKENGNINSAYNNWAEGKEHEKDFPTNVDIWEPGRAPRMWKVLPGKVGFWRELKDDESVPVGSEVSMNFKTGKNFLKLNPNTAADHLFEIRIYERNVQIKTNRENILLISIKNLIGNVKNPFKIWIASPEVKYSMDKNKAVSKLYDDRTIGNSTGKILTNFTIVDNSQLFSEFEETVIYRLASNTNQVDNEPSEATWRPKNAKTFAEALMDLVKIYENNHLTNHEYKRAKEQIIENHYQGNTDYHDNGLALNSGVIGGNSQTFNNIEGAPSDTDMCGVFQSIGSGSGYESMSSGQIITNLIKQHGKNNVMRTNNEKRILNAAGGSLLSVDRGNVSEDISRLKGDSTVKIETNVKYEQTSSEMASGMFAENKTLIETTEGWSNKLNVDTTVNMNTSLKSNNKNEEVGAKLILSGGKISLPDTNISVSKNLQDEINAQTVNCSSNAGYNVIWIKGGEKLYPGLSVEFAELSKEYDEQDLKEARKIVLDIYGAQMYNAPRNLSARLRDLIEKQLTPAQFEIAKELMINATPIQTGELSYSLSNNFNYKLGDNSLNIGGTIGKRTVDTTSKGFYLHSGENETEMKIDTLSGNNPNRLMLSRAKGAFQIQQDEIVFGNTIDSSKYYKGQELNYDLGGKELIPVVTGDGNLMMFGEVPGEFKESDNSSNFAGEVSYIHKPGTVLFTSDQSNFTTFFKDKGGKINIAVNPTL